MQHQVRGEGARKVRGRHRLQEAAGGAVRQGELPVRAGREGVPQQDDGDDGGRAGGGLRHRAAEELPGGVQAGAPPCAGAGVRGRAQGGLLIRGHRHQGGGEAARHKVVLRP